MINREIYNSEGYEDMTCYLALKNIEQQERRDPTRSDWSYRRGDIYLAKLDPVIGSEQGGTRPVVVLQNNIGNLFCPTLVVAPITSQIGKKPHQPTHYCLNNVRGLNEASIVQLEQIKTIDKRRVQKYLGRVSRWQMDEMKACIAVSLGLDIPEEMEAP